MRAGYFPQTVQESEGPSKGQAVHLAERQAKGRLCRWGKANDRTWKGFADGGHFPPAALIEQKEALKDAPRLVMLQTPSRRLTLDHCLA